MALDDAKSMLRNPATISFHRPQIALGVKAHHLGISGQSGVPLREGFFAGSTPFLIADRVGFGGTVQYFNTPIFRKQAFGTSVTARLFRFLSVGARVSALNLSYNRSEFVGVEPGDPVFEGGTGKTTFAKQLAIENSVGYSLNTATPSWTSKDIIGGIGPELTGRGQLSYRTELGCVAEGIKKAREFDIDYTVIIDEITRADISKIFGSLYTAIENPHQTLIETEDGETIELDPRVNIICTMNMSDRTVNELDDAITRRFAMVEVDEYEKDSRRELFETWIDQNIDMSDASGGSPQFEEESLINLFEEDYRGINEGRKETSQGPITRFGPMHYEDVTVFLGKATQDSDLYLEDPEGAVGQAFRTYIVPRLLNSASYPQMERIVQHYKTLDEEFEYNLTPAVKLAERQLDAEKRQMGSYE